MINENIWQKMAEELAKQLELSKQHLDYCNWGDNWERQGTEPLKNSINKALETFNKLKV